MYVHLYVYMYVRLNLDVFSLLCALGILWANYSMAFPEKVPRSDNNTATVYAAVSWIFMLCVTT